jgi:hypothetical protein
MCLRNFPAAKYLDRVLCSARGLASGGARAWAWGSISPRLSFDNLQRRLSGTSGYHTPHRDCTTRLAVA